MKTVSALEVRAHFGELLDEAAAGERIIIERAGQPRAALVPLEDLREIDPDARLERELHALDEIERLARLNPAPPGFHAAAVVRKMRDERAEHIAQVIAKAHGG